MKYLQKNGNEYKSKKQEIRRKKGDKSETEQKKIQACLNYKLQKSLLKSLNKPDSESHHKLNTTED